MKYGLIGERLTHSFSADIHRQLFNYDYELKEIQPDRLESFITGRTFAGINVTIPYKEAVIPYLDVVDDVAQRIGAVNTVVNRNGRLFGYNTDYVGLTELIKRAGFDLTDSTVLILGSGGTSKTAYAVANDLGCGQAVRLSRNGTEGCITYAQAKITYKEADFIINTTPCGMYPNIGVSAIDLADYPYLRGVIDVVYNPLRSRLVCDARVRGIPAFGGLYMLVAQAAYAAQLFVDATVPTDKVETIYRRLAAEKQNVVLVGMPASGKSSVGKMLANMLDFDFVDTDAWIERTSGRSIPDIFSVEGETAFRDLESEAVLAAAGRQRTVIATGGGAVLRSENVQLLRENGRLFFLDRSLPFLTPTTDRPLSADAQAMAQRYHERHGIYVACCDHRIDGDGTLDTVVNLIKEVLNNDTEI
ncbi:MAG: shikimate dehydrogenase [Clostridia bacterium]|nr:shikimate dehydrogenase [Clostridia bacterium]